MLRELLVDVEVLSTAGDLSVEIDNLEFDSREAKPGTLFFAMRGTQTDGHRFIGAAVGLGASAVVCEELPEELCGGAHRVGLLRTSEP